MNFSVDTSDIDQKIAECDQLLESYNAELDFYSRVMDACSTYPINQADRDCFQVAQSMTWQVMGVKLDVLERRISLVRAIDDVYAMARRHAETRALADKENYFLAS